MPMSLFVLMMFRKQDSINSKLLSPDLMFIQLRNKQIELMLDAGCGNFTTVRSVAFTEKLHWKRLF